uniref:Granulins domain-containing protein n=1 Tax=Strigamia maritima TaxID=126957 RepID=T1IYT8_STRMM
MGRFCLTRVTARVTFPPHMVLLRIIALTFVPLSKLDQFAVKTGSPSEIFAPASGGNTKKSSYQLKLLGKSLSTEIVCPDSRRCNGNRETCCEGKDGFSFCCWHPQATCCEDKISCCPSGQRCMGSNFCSGDPWAMFNGIFRNK